MAQPFLINGGMRYATGWLSRCLTGQPDPVMIGDEARLFERHDDTDGDSRDHVGAQPALPAPLRRLAVGEFGQEVQDLEAMIGRSLAHWASHPQGTGQAGACS